MPTPAAWKRAAKDWRDAAHDYQDFWESSSAHLLRECERAATLEADLRAAVAALLAIRAETEPVRTRRVRRNGVIRAHCDAVLSRPTIAALREEGQGE